MVEGVGEMGGDFIGDVAKMGGASSLAATWSNSVGERRSACSEAMRCLMESVLLAASSRFSLRRVAVASRRFLLNATGRTTGGGGGRATIADDDGRSVLTVRTVFGSLQRRQ